MPAEPATAFRSDSLLRFTRLVIAAGALATLIGGALGFAFVGPGIPPVLSIANMGAAALDLLVVWQLGRGHRAAWAFGLAIAIVLTVINLLGLSNMLRAGSPGMVSAGIEVLSVVQLGCLIAVRGRF